MRKHWVDHGSGLFRLNTDTVYLTLNSRAPKNYHTIHSNWTLTCTIKGQYGYACRFHYEFGGTIDEAFERAETILREMFKSIQELI